MLTTIALAVVIFLDILNYLVIFDIILSWLMLTGIQFRPRFLANILDPLYKFVKTYIPSQFGAFDFTPLIIILIIAFTNGIIINFIPEVQFQINQLIS